jgi:hypothetical protein
MRWSLSILFVFASLSAAPASDSAPPCNAPVGVERLNVSLERVVERLRARQPITVVTLGGDLPEVSGATRVAGYSGFLKKELSQRWPEVEVRVVAKGLPGPRASEMLDNVVAEIAELEPALVIWQAGGASAAHDTGLERLKQDLAYGIERLSEIGADVIVMDLQFVRRWDDHPRYMAYLTMVRTVADEEGAGVFRRYDVMKALVEDGAPDQSTAMGSAGLQVGADQCLAKVLADALVTGAS